MKKIVKYAGLLTAVLGMMALAASCNPEPDATDLEFSYTSFQTGEGSNGYISVYLMKSPYKYPVVVDMEVEMTAGKNAEEQELVLDDVIEFTTTDQTYTVEKTDNPRKAIIKGVEVTYTEYNKKVHFSAKDNDFLQNETVVLEFRLTKVDGSEMGSIKNTTLTIVDDEKAPLVKVGYYDTHYTAPTDASRQGRGQFYMRLQKVGKYHYVASGLFGLSRPRLYGEYKPESNTITFDGTDYDHKLWAEATAKDEKPFQPINAFQNDTIWANAYNAEGKITEVLKLRGAGASGTEPIVMTTEEIAENANGVILSIDTPCGFDIYTYNNDMVIGFAPIGTYDAMEQSESMTFSTTDYQSVGTRSQGNNLPTPFSAWSIEE